MKESLTQEEQDLIPVFRKEWEDRLFSCVNRLDVEKITPYINWLYEMAGYPAPKIEYAESPDRVQAIARELTGEDKFHEPASYGSVSDHGWVAFYEYWTKIGIINDEKFNKYLEMTKCNAYYMIQFDTHCIISDMPTKILRNNQGELHYHKGPAVEFSDGYKQYYWRGMPVPEEWIMDKDSITKETVRNEDNAERRRALMEIIGPERFYELIADGQPITLIDQDNDHQGHPMKLFKCFDDLLDKDVQWLEVIDPSTKETFVIFPPNQESKNVFDAKASTFNYEKIQYRQGDVGLLNVSQEFDRPVQET